MNFILLSSHKDAIKPIEDNRRFMMFYKELKPMTEFDELTEKVAIALWQSDSIRATGKLRNIPWGETSEDTKLTFRISANAAIDACEIDQLKNNIQDMFDEMHCVLDGTMPVGDELRTAWLNGKISFSEAIQTHLENGFKS